MLTDSERSDNVMETLPESDYRSVDRVKGEELTDMNTWLLCTERGCNSGSSAARQVIRRFLQSLCGNVLERDIETTTSPCGFLIRALDV